VLKLVETQALYTNFYTFEGVVKALNGVSVVVHQGETYGLVGESGCGKSVSVRSIMRIVQEPGRIENGHILLFFNVEDRKKGIDILKRSEAYMQSIRGNDISMIFQEASTALNPVFTVEKQVGESFFFHRLPQMLEVTLQELDQEIPAASFFLSRIWKAFQRVLFRAELNRLKRYEEQVARIDSRMTELEDREDRNSVNERAALTRMRERLKKTALWVQFIKRIPLLRSYNRRLNKTVLRYVVELLKQLGVPNPDNTVYRYPHELSGGMQQRIVIAIALACHPKLLIADEPTSNLDVTIQAQIMELIKQLKKTTINSVLFITHDLGLVAELCDRVSVMYAGDVCETAFVNTLFRKPLHPYTEGLLNSVPKVKQQETLDTIVGTVPNLINPPTGCRFHPRCPHRMEICPKVKPPLIEYEEDHYVACYLYTSGEKSL
jgi:peptide/nickel transport system ATP-binding protein